ncbi:hypothetical protein B0T26DRAFT_721231 [Lasiosphaeria miniovina]|uniref:Uncharacterized protein n=1 Tax=Lasiosphaeria miniovina TaxID=1954250 RepID=A0AA40DN67_9PEZI|nr:uncharacterized protein B0T26DRAFT_721231 [Lasiosphaeria miniovina]KAK0709340.1 hypothetical protein B0T26DRAFT_721231 [Lasiosphaeria miniovina]
MPAQQLPTPPVPPRVNRDLVTLIITTSPTPSAPSTELLSAVLSSFRAHCPALLEFRVILVIDTYDHITTRARLKKGQVTADFAQKFAAYKDNAKRLILDQYAPAPPGKDADSHGRDMALSSSEAEFGSIQYAKQNNNVPLAISRTRDGRVTFIEPGVRLGFGLAVRSALRLTETPYVWVHQHDWALVADIPIGPLLDIMQEQERHAPAESESDSSPADTAADGMDRQVLTVPVKYVCFPSIRMVSYATSDHVVQFPALRALTNLHKQNFTPRSSAATAPSPEGAAQKIPLTPLFFWHDKPHLATTAHYLALVFPNRMSMLRGAFIEDTAGHRARCEMKDGQWRRWACWLYYPDDGRRLCVRHLKGRTWRGTEAELAKKMEWLQLSER